MGKRIRLESPRRKVAPTELPSLGDRYGERIPAVVVEELASADPIDRFLATDWWARNRSTDPDALAARVIAADLQLAADLIEGRASSPRRSIPELREQVRAHRQIANHAKRDEWIALLDLVTGIESVASTLTEILKKQTPHKELWRGKVAGDNGCACCDCYLNRQVEPALKTFRAAWPGMAPSLDNARLRELIVAFAAPRKGAPKWAVLLPIGIEIVGDIDPDALRNQIARLRNR